MSSTGPRWLVPALVLGAAVVLALTVLLALRDVPAGRPAPGIAPSFVPAPIAPTAADPTPPAADRPPGMP